MLMKVIRKIETNSFNNLDIHQNTKKYNKYLYSVDNYNNQPFISKQNQINNKSMLFGIPRNSPMPTITSRSTDIDIDSPFTNITLNIILSKVINQININLQKMI